jgi:glycerophosphoryl diester phosphodiesterase
MKVYKPLLGDVFTISEKLNSNIKYNIELKAKPEYDNIYTPKPEEFVTLVLKEINDSDVFYKTNLQSFDVRILEEIKRQSPAMKVALLVDENESIDSKLKALSFKPEILSPYFGLLSKESVSNYQQENYQIIPWTINKESDMLEMIEFHVDGIITDYPDKLINLINKD